MSTMPALFRRVAIRHLLLLTIVTIAANGCSDTQADEQAVLKKVEALQQQIEAEREKMQESIAKLQESIKQNNEEVRLLREQLRAADEQALKQADALQKQSEAELAKLLEISKQSRSKFQETIKQNDEEVRLLREYNRRLAEQLEATRQQAHGVKP